MKDSFIGFLMNGNFGTVGKELCKKLINLQACIKQGRILGYPSRVRMGRAVFMVT